MSINAKPWESAGGAATVPDASETTKGKIRIATSAEATTGTDDLTAMTPLTVKERIDAAITGGIEYKGTFDASTGLPSLANAEQGDLYKVSVAGIIYGKSWAVGDHLLINADMGGTVTASKIDKVDNTESVTSVNGQTGATSLGIGDLNNVVISGGGAGGDLVEYDAVDGRWENVTKSTINVGDFNDDATYQLRDAGLTSIAGLTTSADKMIYATASDTYAVTDLTAAGRALLDDADASAQRTTLGLGTAATSDTGDFQPIDAGLTSISGLTTAADKMIYTTASDTYAVADLTAAGRAILDDADASAQRTTLGLGTAATQDVGTSANNVVQLDGSSRLPAVDGSQLTNLPSGGLSAVVDDTTPQLGGALDVNGNAITSAANGNVTINPDGTGDISVGADIIPDADATHTLGSEDNRFITLHSELNGAVQFKARNETGGALTKGQAVYISGVSGDVPLVSLARANSASTMPAHGLLAANVSNNADVQVISFGNLTAYNTTTHSLSLSDTVYVSAATAGALTNTAPTGESNLIQNIGKVVRASATEGIIKVGGAGRSAATPNLDQDKVFLGNASNQAVSTALSSINLTSFNDDLGSTYQPLDAGLTSISGLTTAADKMIYTTASDTYAVTGLTSAGRAILDDADATAQRTTLGLGTAATQDVGTGANNVVQLDGSSRLPAVDGSQLTNLPSGASDLNGLSDVTITSAAGGNLLENNGSGQFVNVAKSTIDVGDFNDDSTYQLRDAGLTSIAGLTTSANKMIYTTASDTYAVADLTAAGRAILDDADASAQRTTLGLGTAATSASTDFQPVDAGLTSISGLTTAADKMIYTTASDTYAVTGLTSAGRAILDDADATAQRATLGLVIGTDVLANVVEDTTPQLGGNLDLNGQDIVTTSNADLDLAPDGTGVVAARGNTTGGNNTGAFKLYCQNNSHWVGFKSPVHADYGTSIIWELPAGDGSANQVLKTDGSGVLSWVDQAGGGGWTYSAITADPANAQAGYHYSCTGTFTITLPTTGVSAGQEVRIKNMGTGTITIDPQTSNIDGSTTDYVMDVQYGAITLVSTGTHWEII